MQAPESSTRRAIPRRAHKKSKTGCRTCKERKVKCDEIRGVQRRPLCLNCERHFRNLAACDFDEQELVFRAGYEAGPSRQPARRRTGRSSAQNTVDLRLLSHVSSRIDPFETRPDSELPAADIDALMGHYLAEFAYRSFPLYANRPLIELWWPFVRDDEVLFHIILLLSSVDRQRLEDQPTSLRTARLLDECLRLVSRRIDDPEKRFNDYTLASIAALLAMETQRGDIRGRNMHLEALKRIIDMRGGLEAIRQTNPMAANFAFWCAMVSIGEPTFLPLTYGEETSEGEWQHSEETATILTHDGGMASLADFDVDVITANVLHRVQQLSQRYTSQVETGSPREATDVLSNLCSILERLLRLSKAPSSDSPIPGLSQSCRLAGCLHLFTPQSGYFPSPTLMLHTLVRDLKRSLTHMIQAIGTKSHLLLWLLSVGGVTAHAMPERSWFVGHLVVVIADLEIRSWSYMRQNLVQLALHDNFCDVSFHSLWNEVKAKQELLNVQPSVD